MKKKGKRKKNFKILLRLFEVVLLSTTPLPSFFPPTCSGGISPANENYSQLESGPKKSPDQKAGADKLVEGRGGYLVRDKFKDIEAKPNLPPVQSHWLIAVGACPNHRLST